MKKLILLPLCFMMLFAAVSCSAKKTDTTKDSQQTGQNVIEEGKPENGSVQETGEMTVDQSSAMTQGNVTFTAFDRDGTSYDDSIFSEHELTMVNFWEPWCNPCVREMPEIEELYENYKDKGFLVIGVYSETNMEYEVDDILSSRNITYPILKYSSDFDEYQTGYVPTTIFVDKNGNIIDIGISYEEIDGTTRVLGAKSYEEWEEIINQYLGN